MSIAVSASAQDAADLDNGKALFKANCAQCHNRNMKDDLTGPALGTTAEMWAEYPREELYAWIRNSQALIEAGHPRATALWQEWGPTVMNAFPNLTDQEIEDILGYIDGVYNGTYGAKPAGDVAAVGVGDTGGNSSLWIFWVVLGFLVVLAFIFWKFLNELRAIEAQKEGRSYKNRTILQQLTSKGVIGFVLFALILIGGYTTVNNAIALNRQQGYKPDQPIKFSHETHAGIHKIDCQYCHDGARRSKHSVIPATNTCMNCHTAIKKGSQYGTEELTKIFVSAGYDPNEDKYIEGYEDMKQDELAEVYKKWISTEFMKDEGIESLALSADREKVELEAERQWEYIVASLTSDVKKKVQGPIEWVRIHNLPDHVYFNHSQHVTVAGLECQTCHGPVEEMEVVQQHSPLSMGWCVNCHRNTNIDGNMADNPYYNEHYHDMIEKHKESGKGITVEDIGGIECQKCHY